MAGSPPNFHKMDSRSACIQGVLKVKVKVKIKGHVIRELSWILGMSYSVIDGLVLFQAARPIKYARKLLQEKGSIADICTFDNVNVMQLYKERFLKDCS